VPQTAGSGLAKTVPLGHDNGGVEPRFVVMSGPAASGKTTLARALAVKLNLPLLAKDTIKTAITSALAVSDPPAARWAGRTAVAVLVALAAESSTGAVLDSVWRSGQADGLRRLDGRVVEVFCRCDLPILKTRYDARIRPPGYVSEHAGSAELWSEETMRPLHGGWPVIEADTSCPVDVPSLAEQVTAALRS
jgi:molybdopterin-guanine dinucleotide biosynthesis protein